MRVAITRAVSPALGADLVWPPTDPQSHLRALINAATSSRRIHSEEVGDTTVENARVSAAKRGVDVQVCGLFIDYDQWDPAFNCDTNPAVPPYRMTGDDYTKSISWQAALRVRNPLSANFMLEFPYSGEGTAGTCVPDTLSPAVKAKSAPLGWINHTFTHANLDFIDYATAKNEI